MVSPLVAWPEQSAEFISLLAADSGAIARGMELSRVPRWSVPLWLLAVHVGVIMSSPSITVHRSKYLFEGLSLVLLTTLTPPFISFAIYFTAWHTASHWRWVFQRLRQKSILGLALLATPMTLLSLAGIVGLGVLLPLEEISLLRWSIIGVSALAVPHMVVVELTTRGTVLDAWSSRHGLEGQQSTDGRRSIRQRV